MNCREIWIRYTDPAGQNFVQEHRVWDADRFLAARHVDAEAANAKARKENPAAPAVATIEQLTHAQYVAARGPRNSRSARA